jgi:hypothetical protein
MAKSSKSMVVFSDIHVGSKYSVCSEEPVLDDGGSYKPSKNQEKLLQGWMDCIDEITQKPTALIINGEPIDGSNNKSLGESCWSTSFGDQMNDSAELIKRIPYEKLYLVRGSGYHVTRESTNFEKIFGKLVGAETYKSVLGNETKTDYEATFEVFGKHIHFTHHVGYSGWWMYRTTPIARELVKMHFNHKANGFHTDLLVRSHVHYYVEVRFPNTIGLTTPAWKFPDGWMYRQGEPELPTVGCMEIIIEPNGKIIVEPHLAEINWRKPVIKL